MAGVPTKKIFLTLYFVSFVLVSAAIVLAVNYQQRRQALVEAQEKARLILDRNMAIHSYFSQQLKPHLFRMSDSYRPGDYFDPVWMSSTYAVREIDQYHKTFSREGYYYKECAINARSPRNEADPMERGFLEELKRDRRKESSVGIRTIDGKPYFVVMRRGESMEKGCLRCHSVPSAAPGDLVKVYGAERSFNRQDGELVSAISIRIPLEEAYASANALSLKLCVLLLGILGLTFTVHFVFMRQLLLEPLVKLRDRTAAILAGEDELGHDIPSLSRARELKQLTGTFNELSRHLRREKDGLVQQVAARTAELQAANQALEDDVVQRMAIQAELAAKVEQLEAALAQVKLLEGVLPICSYCKKIRKDEESWQQMEQYISEHSEALFSHGICPACFETLRDEIRGLPPRKG